MWMRGTSSVWPANTGRMSRNATWSSSECTISASASPVAIRQKRQSGWSATATGLGDDGQRAGVEPELERIVLADVVAVDLNRERAQRPLGIARSRFDSRLGEVVE